MAGYLLTRPERDARETARRLREYGHEAVLVPLLEISELPGDPLDLAGVQALIATSANGVRAFVTRQGGPPAGLRVLCVGDATARAAQQSGLYDVISADGDVGDLARLAGDRLDPPAGALLHVAGSKVAGELAGMLVALGFTYRREVIYDAKTADVLPGDAARAIRDGTVEGVLLYSPRTARTFDRLVTGAGLRDACAGIDAHCLSANVADAAGGPWRAVHIARHPTEDDLIADLAGRRL